jgi:hypothetical protein
VRPSLSPLLFYPLSSPPFSPIAPTSFPVLRICPTAPAEILAYTLSTLPLLAVYGLLALCTFDKFYHVVSHLWPYVCRYIWSRYIGGLRHFQAIATLKLIDFYGSDLDTQQHLFPGICLVEGVGQQRDWNKKQCLDWISQPDKPGACMLGTWEGHLWLQNCTVYSMYRAACSIPPLVWLVSLYLVCIVHLKKLSCVTYLLTHAHKMYGCVIWVEWTRSRSYYNS